MAKVKITVIDNSVGDIILPYGDRLSAKVKVSDYSGTISTNSNFWDQGHWKKDFNDKDSLKLDGDSFNVDVNFSDGRDSVRIKGRDGQGSFDLGEGRDKFTVSKSAENFNGQIYLGLGDDKLKINADNANVDIYTGSSGPFIEADPKRIEVLKYDKDSGSYKKVWKTLKDNGDRVTINGDDFEGSITGSEGNYDEILIKGDNFNGAINDLESGDELIFKAPVYDGTISLNHVYDAQFTKQMDNEFEIYNSTLTGNNKANQIKLTDAEFATINLKDGKDSIYAEGNIESLSLKSVENLELIDLDGFTGTLISNKATKVSLNDANHDFSLGKSKMKIDLGNEDSEITLTANFTGQIQGGGNNILNISDNIYSKSGSFIGFNTIHIGESVSARFNVNQLEKLANSEDVNILGTSGSEIRGLSNWLTDGTVGDGIDDTFKNDQEAFNIIINDHIGNSFDGSHYLFA